MRVVLESWGAARVGWLGARVPDADFVAVDREDLATALRDADAVICTALSAADLEPAVRLRLVQVLGAGLNGVEVDALPAGCTLCNVYGHERAIAEWIVMAMLALSRRLLPHDRNLRRGEWPAANRIVGVPERELRGRTVGMVGFGHIGREAALLSRALGMRTIAVTRSPDSARPVGALDHLGGYDELPLLFDESDFVVVCVPLSPETRGLIGERELRLLGPNGYLLNVARGEVVDEGSLYAALRDRAIAGAAVDVWYRYPERPGATTMPASLPFWELENVLMTPHASGWTESTVETRWEFVVDQLIRLREGQLLENVVREAS
jgi:phosphoglycerate dehydrogenase-like enzyme